MHPVMRSAFNTLLARELKNSAPHSVLEVGATLETTLLDVDALTHATVLLGVNIDKSSCGEAGRVKIAPVERNQIPLPDDTFDVVLSNATLEHDPFFWRTASEMRRVLKPGGLVVIGVPAFSGDGDGCGVAYTHHLHRHPVDCYRFGEDAVEAILEGFPETHQMTVMTPPRLICWARKPL